MPALSIGKSGKYLIALIILALIFYQVGLAELWDQLSEVTLGSVIYLLLIGVLLIYISALKWQMFLEVFAERIPVIRLFLLYLVGYFVNMILPSYVGGDALRSWQVGKKVGQHQALAATVLERYTGGLAMLSLAFCFMWFLEAVTPAIKMTIAVLFLSYLMLSVFALSQSLLSLMRALRVPEKLIGHFDKLRDALNFARRNPALFFKAMSLSYLFHFVTVINVMAAAIAVGWHTIPFYDLIVVLPIILAIGFLPVTPSGLGLQEGAFYFFLQILGASPAQATAVAVLLRAKTYVLALCGGMAWPILKRAKE